MASPPHLTLYRVDGAYSFVPHALLLHLELPFTAIRMHEGPQGYEAADGSFTHADYCRDINPAGFVPAITFVQDDGNIATVTELPAVLTLIVSIAGERAAPLLGRAPLEKARVMEWIAWLSTTIAAGGLAMVFRPQRFVDTDDKAVQMELHNKGIQISHCAYAQVEARLRSEARVFAIDGLLTVVDFTLYIIWRWGSRVQLDMMNNYPRYKRLVMAVENLEAVQQTLEIEHLNSAL